MGLDLPWILAKNTHETNLPYDDTKTQEHENTRDIQEDWDVYTRHSAQLAVTFVLRAHHDRLSSIRSTDIIVRSPMVHAGSLAAILVRRHDVGDVMS